MGTFCVAILRVYYTVKGTPIFAIVHPIYTSVNLHRRSDNKDSAHGTPKMIEFPEARDNGWTY